ncbi:MAG: hypothetical protein IAG10_03990 [Planctomycetaceae bacterium]|nr:hypothetical protein [Planctomycetaceae bacterium]
MTDRARRVMVLAEVEAKRLRSTTVEPEHVLLGLADEGSNVSVNVLRRLWPGFEQFRSAYNAIVPAGDGNLCDPASCSARTERLVARAHDEMQQLKVNYVGTEHLLLAISRELLAISRETDGFVPQLLVACAIRPEDIRRETYELLGHGDLARKDGTPADF